MCIRSTHFANLGKKVEKGEFKMGGAILDEVPQDDEPGSLKFAGSTVIVVAASKEEVLDHLKADVYVEAGVWDLEKVQMWPMKTAFRSALQ